MSLKQAYEPYFKIGAAISRRDLANSKHMELLTTEFGSFTCENDMKPMFLLDREASLANLAECETNPAVTFETAKPYLRFAKENHLPMRGHTLVWHNQTPKWFFHTHYDENEPFATREVMLCRLENYIRKVLTYIQENYPGIIYAWDVVNEIVDEGDFRKSLWNTVVGEDFFIYAFTFARKYADPEVLLFYNDYTTYIPWKRDFICEKVLKPLMEKGLVDGMGMQSHLVMDEPELEDYKTALETFGALKLVLHMTELDIHNADPSPASMEALADRYKELFSIMVAAKKEGKANIDSVTFWCLLDEGSWLTGFRRETSYPLLFHGDCEPKAAYYAVLDVVK